jgi:cytochrome bd-type quinol oxidase subunit 2
VAEHKSVTGPGRVLVAVYAIFALAATSRAGVQIGTKFHEAPLAYLLSAVAAVIYILATVALASTKDAWRRVALVSCSIEFLGVLVVGTLSVFDTAAFPDATVWSVYGRGYGFIPLVLPILGLLWLRHTSRSTAAAES